MEFYTTIFSLSAKEKNYWSAYSLDSSDHLDNVLLFGIDVVDATKRTDDCAHVLHHSYACECQVSKQVRYIIIFSQTDRRSSGLCPSPAKRPLSLVLTIYVILSRIFPDKWLTVDTLLSLR
ncbi:unnamed protein product [Peronospora belbahrii]|uniref:Uncharacterized protein n=1 Tax=Peronospora belbahrii TaxID=622444 RepID=A0ABN8CUH9_9STRA|nr:unnamed protein product [Peronospora belbahrii]